MDETDRAIETLLAVRDTTSALAAIGALGEAVRDLPLIDDPDARLAPAQARRVDEMLVRIQREWPDLRRPDGTVRVHQQRALALSLAMTLLRQWKASTMAGSIAEAVSVVRAPFDQKQESYRLYEVSLNLLGVCPRDVLSVEDQTSLLPCILGLARFVDLDRPAFALVGSWYATDDRAVTTFVDMLASISPSDRVAIQSAAYWLIRVKIQPRRDREALLRLAALAAKSPIVAEHVGALLARQDLGAPAKKAVAKKPVTKTKAVAKAKKPAIAKTKKPAIAKTKKKPAATKKKPRR